nr:MAG TPA: hypothetical protein [Caudoviricetes sp.]
MKTLRHADVTLFLRVFLLYLVKENCPKWTFSSI